MRTRFLPRKRPEPAPDPRVVGTQIELDGLTLRGGVPEQHESGAFMAFTELDGWFNPPASSGETTDRVLAHGGWDNRATYGARYITVKGIVWGLDDTTIEAGLNALAAAIPLDERRPFVVRRHGFTQHVMARQEDQPVFDWDGGDTAEFDLQFSAADYRRLQGNGTGGIGGDGWTRLGPDGLPSTSGGLSVPFTVPFAIRATTTSGRLTVATNGTAPPNVVVEFHGPVEDPGIWCLETGQRLWFNISLTRGQTLSVDLARHSVLLNGVSRRSTKRGDWIDLPRGAGSRTFEFTSPTFNSDARFTINYQEGWL